MNCLKIALATGVFISGVFASAAIPSDSLECLNIPVALDRNYCQAKNQQAYNGQITSRIKNIRSKKNIVKKRELKNSLRKDIETRVALIASLQKELEAEKLKLNEQRKRVLNVTIK